MFQIHADANDFIVCLLQVPHAVDRHWDPKGKEEKLLALSFS